MTLSGGVYDIRTVFTIIFNSNNLFLFHSHFFINVLGVKGLLMHF